MAELLPTPTRIGLVRRRLSRVTWWLSFAAAILPLAAYAVLARFGGAGAISAAAAAMLARGALTSLPLAAISFLAGRDLFGKVGFLRREGDELVIVRGGSERRLPLSAVRGGIIVPERERVSVELQLEDGNHVTTPVADVATAEALLRELRVDVTHRRCRVQLEDRAAATVIAAIAPLGLAYFCAVTLGAALGPPLQPVPGNLILVMAVGFYAVTSAFLQRLIAVPDVTIGADGLAFRRRFGETFVPFTDLADVRLTGSGVQFVLRSGRALLVRSIAAVSNVRFEALKLRIREAMAARAAAPAQALEQLDRRDRSLPEWRAALAALARRGVSYRAAGLSSDDLEALLSSPDATAERRIGAAVALSAGKHPASLERVRIAAAQCASQRLRVALEQVSEGAEDDAAIAEALDEEARRAPEARR